jgi:hypothetical protein
MLTSYESRSLCIYLLAVSFLGLGKKTRRLRNQSPLQG